MTTCDSTRIIRFLQTHGGGFEKYEVPCRGARSCNVKTIAFLLKELGEAFRVRAFGMQVGTPDAVIYLACTQRLQFRLGSARNVHANLILVIVDGVREHCRRSDGATCGVEESFET